MPPNETRNEKKPHPATVQRKAAEPPHQKDKPPHPATAQRKAAEPRRKEAKSPHPATVQRATVTSGGGSGGLGGDPPKQPPKGGGGCRGFKDSKSRYQHYKKKGRSGAQEEGPIFDSMGFASAEEYEQAGIAFMSSPDEYAVDVTNGQGYRMRYDSNRNWLGIMDNQGYLRTFYAPGVAFDWDMNIIMNFMRPR